MHGGQQGATPCLPINPLSEGQEAKLKTEERKAAIAYQQKELQAVADRPQRKEAHEYLPVWLIHACGSIPNARVAAHILSKFQDRRPQERDGQLYVVPIASCRGPQGQREWCLGSFKQGAAALDMPESTYRQSLKSMDRTLFHLARRKGLLYVSPLALGLSRAWDAWVNEATDSKKTTLDQRRKLIDDQRKFDKRYRKRRGENGPYRPGWWSMMLRDKAMAPTGFRQSSDMIAAPTQPGQEQQASYDLWQRIKAGNALNRLRTRAMVECASIEGWAEGLKGSRGGGASTKNAVAPADPNPADSVTQISSCVKTALISVKGKQPIRSAVGENRGGEGSARASILTR